MQEDAVDADPDPLSCEGHADADLPAGDADAAAGVDDPVDLDGGGLWLGLRQRRRAGGCAAVSQEAGQVALGQPGWAGLDPAAVGGQDVQPVGVDPDRDWGAGEGRSEPYLLLGDGQVA
ncbi:hypothetical protein [Micromonospora pattaloongensis]|uniref:hypothetical protein n=1 Tax=Micromonospora pattaloongensis TaxID=405436 RepID=UPI000B848CBF|nr:hypothetical protein [Micromonospora pattaloongensis]